MKYTREDYIKKNCSFREYHAQFVTTEIKEILLRRIEKRQLLSLSERGFNDIPVKRWDAIAQSLPITVKRKLKEAGDNWSKAGGVCILKEAAKQIIEDHYRDKFWSYNPELKDEYFQEGKRQNEYKAEVRGAFVNFVDSQNRAGEMTDEIANIITL